MIYAICVEQVATATGSRISVSSGACGHRITYMYNQLQWPEAWVAVTITPTGLVTGPSAAHTN